MLNKLNAWLDGKKTLIAGLAILIAAFSNFLSALSDGFQMADAIGFFKEFGQGLAVLGLGHKLFKINNKVD